MKAVVTGAAGFIGSHLSEKLLSEGYEVIGVDSFIDYYPRSVKEKNIEGFINNSNFKFVEGNILDLDFGKLLRGVDYVFHQAAQAGVRSSWGESFSIYTENNILATQKLLEAAKDKPLKKFVYASSSSVYGDAEKLPAEETAHLKPVSPYGVSKLAAENLTYLYWKNFNVPAVSLRYFTVFGERQRPDMAFNIFIKAALAGKEITVFGDGSQSRSFIYVSDIVRANLSAAESDIEGEVFNIAGEERIVLNDVIDMIAELTGKEVNINYIARVKGDARHTAADCSKAARLLGFKPRVSFAEGLEREIEWLGLNM